MMHAVIELGTAVDREGRAAGGLIVVIRSTAGGFTSGILAKGGTLRRCLGLAGDLRLPKT